MYMDDICPWCYNKAEHHVDHETTRSLLKSAAKIGANLLGCQQKLSKKMVAR